ncbi:hypothetical protein D3C72_1784660 [compost metagenome]
MLLLLATRLIGDIDIWLPEPLLGKHFLEPVDLVFQGFTHANMAAGEGNLRLLLRCQVNADIQPPQLCWLQLDIGRFQTLAGEVHHPIDQAFSPAPLVHRQRLMQRRCSDRYRCGGFYRGRLGQGTQALSEVIHTGVTGGALEVLEAIIQ